MPKAKTVRINSVTLAHYLYVVADHYAELAKALRAAMTEHPEQLQGHERIAADLDHDQAHARKFAEALDNSERLFVDGDQFCAEVRA